MRGERLGSEGLARVFLVWIGHGEAVWEDD